MLKKIKQCAEFIGYAELGVFFLVLLGILVYVDRDERQAEMALMLQPEVPPMPVRRSMPLSSKENSDSYFRYVRPEQWQYLIEDMSRWSDSTCTEGWITFPKSMPGYMDLVATEAQGPYYLWAQDGRHFPEGALLRIYEIRQDSTRIQFLFTVKEDMDGMRKDMAGELDSLLQQMHGTDDIH